MSTAGGPRRGVVFVGGTPFSGAGDVAGLLGARPGAFPLPVQARFHSDPRGIPALLGGRIGFEDFIAELRRGPAAAAAGQQTLDAAIAGLRASYDDDPLEACRALFWALLDAIAPRDGAALLVEASPHNIVEAHTLARLAPDSRFVHVIRDGRDVAAAAVESRSGPARMGAGLQWWADRLWDVERGVRGEEDGAPYAVAEDRLATVVLDELVARDGEAASRELLEWLGLGGGEEAPVLAAGAVGRGRWRRHARGPAAWWISRSYAATLEELRDKGSQAASLLEAARGRLG